MAARREAQKLIRSFQSTLASISITSTNPFSSTHLFAAPLPLVLDVANTHTSQRSKTIHTFSSSKRWQPPTPSSNYSSAPATSADSSDSSADDMQQEVLNTALTLVRQLGWTRNALQTAAAHLGLSPAIAGSFPRGAVHLVEAFNTRCNDRLREILVERKEEIDEMDTEDKLAFGVKLRLDMVTDYVESWPDALALQAHPSEVAYTLQNYGTIADILWRAAGDDSTDFSWYTKRAAISGMYIAAELYFLTDKSEGYKDTWKFVENRIRDMGTMLTLD